MAEYVELLVKAVDATHSDPEKDLRGCYKRGDVVDIRPAGFTWGKKEGPPKFQVIKMLKSEADKLALLEPETVEKTSDLGTKDERIEQEVVRRRKQKVELDSLVAKEPTEKVELTADKVASLVITKPSGKVELAKVEQIKVAR